MWSRCLVLLILLGALALAGCAPTSGPVEASPTPTRVRVSGSGTALPVVQKLAEAYGRQFSDVRVQFEPGTNSGGAIQGVLQGTLEFAVANRFLTAAEASEPLEYRAFARDAVVFAAHLPNPVPGLSTAQLRDIYGGSLTDWRQLGHPAGLNSAPIIVLDRDEDESARKLVLLPLLNGRPVQARAVVLATAGEMVRALESTPGALGYTSLSLLRILQAHEIQVLALDGVMPGPETLTRGTYPWHITFGLIHRRDAPPAVRRFLEFVQGPGGLQVLRAYDALAIEG